MEEYEVAIRDLNKNLETCWAAVAMEKLDDFQILFAIKRCTSMLQELHHGIIDSTALELDDAALDVKLPKGKNSA